MSTDKTHTALLTQSFGKLAPPALEQTDLTQYELYLGFRKTGFSLWMRLTVLPLKAYKALIGKKHYCRKHKKFAEGLRANNALLWGARGTGKSSVLKAVHGHLLEQGHHLGLVEIQREDLDDLPDVIGLLAQTNRPLSSSVMISNRTIFCKSSSVLEGGLSGRPANIVFYATSNRRHLMPDR